MGELLPVLNKRFTALDEYARGADDSYSLLPLRFLPLDDTRVIVTNFADEFIVLTRDQLADTIGKRLKTNSRLYDELKSKHFVLDAESSIALELLAAKHRTKRAQIANFTSLHLFVVTLRCDHSCPYCQVSRQSEDRAAFDMTEAMADAGIEFMFRSPSPTLKVEFQGGESLLNFSLIEYIVNAVKRRNVVAQRDIQFVIATNLSPLNDHHLDFCAQHDILISTSLDGPKALHNANRPRPGKDSHERTIAGIRRVREVLGPHSISALMTTTAASLDQPEAIIDEYVKHGFHSIFLRSISPFGFAVRTGYAKAYDSEAWLTFYRRGLAHILELNRQGILFREEYAAMLLRKMLTPFPIGYVDLQSPAGIGVSVVVFNYDGDVYASDEARMLAEMGDRTYRLGNVLADPYEVIMSADALLGPLEESMAEAVPACADCGIQPYCGSDPVYHHRMFGDPVGFKPASGFCAKNMGVVRHLVRLLEDDDQAARILQTWAY